MADRHRSYSLRGAHALSKPPRHASELQKKASACPTHSPAPFASLSPPPRAAPSRCSSTLPAKLRHRLAHAPLQKHVAQFAQSLAVISSTSSISQSVRLSLGKREFVSSSTAVMSGLAGVGAPRGQLSSRPLPSLLSLALGLVNATEARRVTR